MNFLLKPGLPPVYPPLNDTNVCPGIQVPNLGVLLNISLPERVKLNPSPSPATQLPKHRLNVSTSFPFSLQKY